MNAKHILIIIINDNYINDLEYVYPDGSGQACPFEVHSWDPYNKKRFRMSYISYSKDGTIFGYGSNLFLIPALSLSKY